jgi:hypothetical protein
VLEQTNVSIAAANGISGSVATETTTPAITLTLGAITPTSIGGITTVTTQNANDNSTKIASTAYADAKVADFINDGAATIAPSQNAVFDALALKGNLAGGNSWTSSQSFSTSISVGSFIASLAGVNRFNLSLGGSSTPPIWSRNTADAVTTAVFDNIHASNTGHIAEFRSAGTTQVNITKAGNVYFPSSADGIVLTSPDGTKYQVIVTNGGTLQTSIITTP